MAHIISFGFVSALKNFIYSVQFILNELNSSYFLTLEIRIKILSLESLTAYHPENCKIFRLS